MNIIELTKVQQIADTYGFEPQREMLVEECAELIQAVQKIKRAEEAEKLEKATTNFLEELADVSIMIEQMRYLLPAQLVQELDNNIAKKLDRQIERIEKAKEQEKEQYSKWRAGVNA